MFQGSGKTRTKTSATTSNISAWTLLSPRSVYTERRAGQQAERERRHDRDEAIHENGSNDLGVVSAESHEKAPQTDLDDSDAAWSDRDRAQQARQRPSGESLDRRDLR